MNKWLFWALVAVGLWVFLMSVAKKNKRRDQANEKAQEQAQREQAKPLTTTACARCGLHIAQGDAVLRNGRFYCGQAHAKLGES